MTGDAPAGRVSAILGSVVRVRLDRDAALGEIMHVGDERLHGEVIELEGVSATLQVYEETAGMRAGTPVFASGHPFEVELGPGLLGGVFDGVQRPLQTLATVEGDFMGRGQHEPALARDRLWEFAPRVKEGECLTAGAVFGAVQETGALEHRLLVPPAIGGRVTHVTAAGPHRIGDVVAILRDDRGTQHDLRLFHRWRVRRPRPIAERLPPAMPMLTGQRVLDTFFPLPRGGACGMPGGFGTGKTVTQQQLCMWADADVIVYVGCGERGNEMTEMLTKLPALVDPRTDAPLADRTVLVANTSNMPVPAREASIYTGVTIAEYYRDMGYHTALLADSTSRWAEALRDISGRLGEMPAEEGYPSYLASRLASYYERAGRVRTLGGGEGSVTLISAISPPGGDLTEPVTRHTQRFTQCFWTLDKALAEARMFPAISLRHSYSHLPRPVVDWWADAVGRDWASLRQEALGMLNDATQAEATARLVGSETLPEPQQWLIFSARLFEDGFLRQNAFDRADAYCSPARQYRLLSLLLHAHQRGVAALTRGVTTRQLTQLPVLSRLTRARSEIGDDAFTRLDELRVAIDAACAGLENTVSAVLDAPDRAH
jgi:V/A-type H+-transporting ATPase subunit A